MTAPDDASIPEPGINSTHEPDSGSETERAVPRDRVVGRPRHTPAIQRVVAEIEAGLRHGYFDYSVTCEVVGHGRRRLVLRAGKSYQFVIPAEECETSPPASDVHMT